MLIEQPFDVVVPYYVSRKRNPIDVVETRIFPVTLREVAAVDAPIVFWWQQPHEDESLSFAWRIVDGRFYAPVVVPVERGLSLSDPSTAMVAVDVVKPPRPYEERRRDAMEPLSASAWAASKLAGDVTPPGMSEKTFKAGKGAYDYPPDVRKYDLQHVERMQGQLDEFYARMLVVDDVLHRECRTPFLSLSILGARVVSDLDRNDPVVFDLASFDEARRHLEALCESQPHFRDPFTKAVPDISHLEPRILRRDLLPAFDTERRRIELLARKVVDLCQNGRSSSGYRHGTPILEQPADSMRAYAELRRSLKEDEEIQAVQPREVFDALVSFLETDRGRMVPDDVVEVLRGLVPDVVAEPRRPVPREQALRRPAVGQKATGEPAVVAELEMDVDPRPASTERRRMRFRIWKSGDDTFFEPDDGADETALPQVWHDVAGRRMLRIVAPCLAIDAQAGTIFLSLTEQVSGLPRLALQHLDQAVDMLGELNPQCDRSALPDVAHLDPALDDATATRKHATSVLKDVVEAVRHHLPYVSPDLMDRYAVVRSTLHSSFDAPPPLAEVLGSCVAMMDIVSGVGIELKPHLLQPLTAYAWLEGRFNALEPEDEDALSLMM